MMYYLNTSYTMSNLGALEKKALPWLKLLTDRIMTDGQIEDVKKRLNELREKLEMENPRCKGVAVSVELSPYTERLFIRFGRQTIIGTPCEPLNIETLKI